MEEKEAAKSGFSDRGVEEKNFEWGTGEENFPRLNFRWETETG